MDGNTLTQRRERLGLSRHQLAEAVGISHVTVWRIETTGKLPTVVVARALEDTLSRLERAAVVSSEAAS